MGFQIPKTQTKNLLSIAVTYKSCKNHIIFPKALGCPTSFCYGFVTQLVQVWAPASATHRGHIGAVTSPASSVPHQHCSQRGASCLLSQRLLVKGSAHGQCCLIYVVPRSSQIPISENEMSILIPVELMPSLHQVLLLSWVSLCVLHYNELQPRSMGKGSSERSPITIIFVVDLYFMFLNGWYV